MVRFSKCNRRLHYFAADWNYCWINRSWFAIVCALLTLGMETPGCGPFGFFFKQKDRFSAILLALLLACPPVFAWTACVIGGK